MKKQFIGWIFGVSYISFLLGVAIESIGQDNSSTVTWTIVPAILFAMIIPFVCGYLANSKDSHD